MHCLYWYNERANVGALAGAVWKQGGMALEEYPAEKGSPGHKQDGRVDLFASIGDNKTIFEAKVLWLHFHGHSKKSWVNEIDSKLEDACSDATKSLRRTKGYRAAGIVFVLPYWQSKHQQGQDQLDTLEQDIKECETSFTASYVHSEDMKSSKGNVCNAVYLIGRGV
jgi:hypothetical protein